MGKCARAAFSPFASPARQGYNKCKLGSPCPHGRGGGTALPENLVWEESRNGKHRFEGQWNELRSVRQKVRRAVNVFEGYESAKVDLEKGEVTIEFEPRQRSTALSRRSRALGSRSRNKRDWMQTRRAGNRQSAATCPLDRFTASTGSGGAGRLCTKRRLSNGGRSYMLRKIGDVRCKRR